MKGVGIISDTHDLDHPVIWRRRIHYRKGLLFGIVLLSAALLISQQITRQHNPSAVKTSLNTAVITKQQSTTETGSSQTPVKPDPVAAGTEPQPNQAQPVPANNGQAESPQTSPEQLIDDLLTLLDQPLSDLQAERFRELMAELAAQGQAALPVIRDYLLSGEDHLFPDEGKFGHPSLRLAMIDALQKTAAEDVPLISLVLLQSQVSAPEFIALSGYLEKSEPGFYQTEITAAGRQFLAQAAETNSTELGPVYELLGQAGATSVADLTAAPSHLSHYASVGLALLPDGQGVPALLDQIHQSDLKFDDQQELLQLKLLAQVAAEQADAAAALAEFARQKLIPDSAWPEIAAIAAGLERIQLNRHEGTVLSSQQIASPYGYQVLYRTRVSGHRGTTEALARLELIELLHELAPGNGAGEALATVLDRLSGAQR